MVKFSRGGSATLALLLLSTVVARAASEVSTKPERSEIKLGATETTDIHAAMRPLHGRPALKISPGRPALSLRSLPATHNASIHPYVKIDDTADTHTLTMQSK
jgi:hypothetical protein